MVYYIGIDGGGTKTSFSCYNDEGEHLATVELGTTHVAQVTDEEAQKILKTGVMTLLKELSINPEAAIVKIGAGLAGYGINQLFREKIERNCQSAFSGFTYVISNDAEVALLGALDGRDGILLVAGTGSIGYAKENEAFYRVGGWGNVLGDEGSAFWIAKQILHTFTCQSDGRLPRTALYQLVKDTLQLTHDGDIVKYAADHLYSERTKTAQLAKLGEVLLQANDPSMAEIYREAGKQLATLANALAKQFNTSQAVIPVSTIGGVWKAGEVLTKSFQNHLEIGLKYTPAQYSATYGAYLLAKHRL